MFRPLDGRMKAWERRRGLEGVAGIVAQHIRPSFVNQRQMGWQFDSEPFSTASVCKYIGIYIWQNP